MLACSTGGNGASTPEIHLTWKLTTMREPRRRRGFRRAPPCMGLIAPARRAEQGRHQRVAPRNHVRGRAVSAIRSQVRRARTAVSVIVARDPGRPPGRLQGCEKRIDQPPVRVEPVHIFIDATVGPPTRHRFHDAGVDQLGDVITGAGPGTPEQCRDPRGPEVARGKRGDQDVEPLDTKQGGRPHCDPPIPFPQPLPPTPRLAFARLSLVCSILAFELVSANITACEEPHRMRGNRRCELLQCLVASGRPVRRPIWLKTIRERYHE
jgi:hypothetical protein